jgi:osmotically-inducible protein OsmY
MRNPQLESAVSAELTWDPHLDESADIAVAASGGAVTLHGSVSSLRHKLDAQRAAERVHGVSEVVNDLRVEIMADYRRDDAELCGDVLQALMLDAVVPSTIHVMARNGVVTLTGTVLWRFQRVEALFLAANVLGVVDVVDAIRLRVATLADDEVAGCIAGALRRDALLRAEAVSVSVRQGRVTLMGTVGSRAALNAAIAIAWAGRGVTDVVDHLAVAG